MVASQLKPTSWYVNKEDAQQWQVKTGDLLAISSVYGEIILPVEVTEYLADGCIGYTAGQTPLMPQVAVSVRRTDRIEDAYRPAAEASLDNIDVNYRNPLFAPSDTIENAAPATVEAN